MKTYDLIIIGGGAAGLAAAEYAARLRKKVALVEASRLGGGSLWSGCVPSKTLLHEAHKIFKHGRIETQQAYMRAKERIVAAEHKIVAIHDNKARFEKLGVTVYMGTAIFTSDKTIKVAHVELKASHFLIATGSRPAAPPIPGLESVNYLTTDTIFELERVPKSLVVVGGGPNGVELAQAFNRLGVKVTLLQRGERLLPRDDEEVAEFIAEKLKEDGVAVRCSASIEKVESAGGKIAVFYNHEGKNQKLMTDGLLVVTGRKSAIEGLDLEAAGVRADEKGVWCDAKLATSAPHIYVAGDVEGAYGFTHYAAAQGVHAVQNMFEKPHDFNPREVPWVTFTDPEAAHVGELERELKKAGKKYRRLYLPYKEVERAITEGHTEGFFKILVGGDGKILGAQIVGERAGELIHEIVVAMEFGITLDKLATVIHAYPTYSSGLGQLYAGQESALSAGPVPMSSLLKKLESMSAKGLKSSK